MIAALLCERKESTVSTDISWVPVLGRPLCWYPINAALSSKNIDKYYFSGNDEKMRNFASRHGFATINGPSEPGTGKDTLEKAFISGYKEIVRCNGGERPELMVLLVSNTATILARDIDKGVEVLRADPTLDSAVTISCYNMWSPLRARRIGQDGILHPFVPFETFGNPRTMSCDRDSQGDTWFPDLAVNVVRPRNLENPAQGLPPERWVGRKIYPLKQEASFEFFHEWQLPQTEWWLRQHGF